MPASAGRNISARASGADPMQRYGIIEVVLGAVGFAAFYIWQMRSLKRDVAEREAREATEAAQSENVQVTAVQRE